MDRRVWQVYSPWGLKESNMTQQLSLTQFHISIISSFQLFVHWRRKWQPTPVFLTGESQGQRSLLGCRLWGHTELDTTEETQQQQQLFVRDSFSRIISFIPYLLFLTKCKSFFLVKSLKETLSTEPLPLASYILKIIQVVSIENNLNYYGKKCQTRKEN